MSQAVSEPLFGNAVFHVQKYITALARGARQDILATHRDFFSISKCIKHLRITDDLRGKLRTVQSSHHDDMIQGLGKRLGTMLRCLAIDQLRSLT